MGLILLMFIPFVACNSNKEQFVGSWIEVMPMGVDFKQGVTLNEDGSASSINMSTMLYRSWKIDGDMLILNGKSIGNGVAFDFSDTLKIIRVTPDSLILNMHSGYQLKYVRQ